MPGLGMSWSVPVYILNGRHSRPGLISAKEPAPPMNVTPHPYDLPYPTVMQEYHLAVEEFNLQQADERWAGGNVQMHAAQEGWGVWPNALQIWPAIPQEFRGINLREAFAYEGPSMMDGVAESDNSSDDAMDAWNEHVAEVEAAALGLLTGNIHTNLVFVRAGGSAQAIAIPVFPCFLSFLGWLMRQVYTRAIMPVDHMQDQRDFVQFITQLIEVIAHRIRDNAISSHSPILEQSVQLFSNVQIVWQLENVLATPSPMFDVTVPAYSTLQTSAVQICEMATDEPSASTSRIIPLAGAAPRCLRPSHLE